MVFPGYFKSEGTFEILTSFLKDEDEVVGEYKGKDRKKKCTCESHKISKKNGIVDK